jgi:hypothetical protein
MRKKVAIAIVALLGGALMLPNHEAFAHGGGFGGGGFHGGGFGGGGFRGGHSAVEDLAAMDMDVATMVTGAVMDMGSATDTTVVTEPTAGMLAIPSIPTTSVAIIRTARLIPFAGDCRSFLLALSNRQPGAELRTPRN